MGFSLTIIIIAVTCLVSYLAFQNRALMDRFIFNPYLIKREGQWYRAITSGFLHGDYNHLLINMFVLYFFGRNVEILYGRYLGEYGLVAFLALYFLALLISDLTTYRKHKDNPRYLSLGASGAVMAVLFADIIMDPMNTIYLYAIVPLNAVLFGIAYLGYTWYQSKQSGGNVNHDAHFLGAIFGIVFTILLRPAFAMEFIEKITTGISSLLGG